MRWPRSPSPASPSVTALRYIGRPERVAVWLIPAAAIGYIPAWALPPEWAVVAYAGLAALLLVHRRTRLAMGWLRDEAEIVIAVAYWAVGVAESLAAAAAFSDIFPDHPGARVGVPGLAALVAAGGVATWSLRTPRRLYIEFVLVAPFAVFAYLLADVFSAHQTIWVGLAVAAAVAALVHVPPARRTLGEQPLLLIAVGYLAGALAALAVIDQTLLAFTTHGRSDGWGTVALAVPVSLVVASAFRDRRERSYAVWAAFALATQLAAMVLPGQWVVVAWAGLSALASAIAIVWPAPLSARAVRRPFQELAAGSAVALTALVAAVYETPTMLFMANHTPASGLAAALAVTGAIGAASWAAAAGAGASPWTVGGVPVAKAGACLFGAASLWTLAAALLGATQLRVAHPSPHSVHDAFQQGQVLVSTSWVLVGLALVVASIRRPPPVASDRRHRTALRRPGQALPVRPGVPDRDGPRRLVHRHRLGAAGGGAPAPAVRGAAPPGRLRGRRQPGRRLTHLAIDPSTGGRRPLLGRPS